MNSRQNVAIQQQLLLRGKKINMKSKKRGKTQKKHGVTNLKNEMICFGDKRNKRINDLFQKELEKEDPTSPIKFQIKQRERERERERENSK